MATPGPHGLRTLATYGNQQDRRHRGRGDDRLVDPRPPARRDPEVPQVAVMRPLDRLPSIKLKLTTAILAGVAVIVLVVTFGSRWGLGIWVVVPAATLLSLAMIHILARGMTAPLRDMVRQ